MAPAAPPFQHALGHRRYVRKFLKKRPELNHYKSSNLCPLRAEKATPKVRPLRRAAPAAPPPLPRPRCLAPAAPPRPVLR